METKGALAAPMGSGLTQEERKQLREENVEKLSVLERDSWLLGEHYQAQRLQDMMRSLEVLI